MFKSLCVRQFFFLAILYHSVGFSQKNEQENLKDRIEANGILFQINIDQAFQSIDSLLLEAVHQKDTLAELRLLDRKCRYFYQKNQVDSLIKASEQLDQKASIYNNSFSRVMANVYLSCGYSINHFYNEALSYLKIANEIIEKEDCSDPSLFLAKSNILTSFARIYIEMEEPEKAVEKLLEVIKSYDILDNPEDIKKFQYLNYSNIARAYVYFNLNLAEYYALQSIKLKPDDKEDDKVMMINYYVLGRVNKERKSYEKALHYYQKAIKTYQVTGEELNIKNIFTDLVELYKETGRQDSSLFFENQLKKLEISFLQSKYNSLSDLISKPQIPKKSENKNPPSHIIKIVVAISILLLFSFVIIFFFLKRKQNNLQENISEKRSSLIQLIKHGDPTFLLAFEELYPDFSKKLLQVNPHLATSEIEFCALLKLNLSTKDIAKLTYIQVRTVQNKKYRIRRRLKIPHSVDIYNWFRSF